MNGVNVGPKSIRGELKAACRRLIQFLSEDFGISRRAPSKMPSENQLCVALDSNKAVGIAALRITREVSPFLAADKAPQLVTLNLRDGHGVDYLFKDSGAFFTSENQQRKNRGVVNSGDSLDCADRAPLNKKLDNSHGLFHRSVHVAQRFFAFFRESLGALGAAVALQSVPVLPKLFAFNTAIVAGHFGLSFPRSKPIMDSASAFAAYPAIADLAPSLVQARGGASFLLPTESKRPSNLTADNLPTVCQPLQAGINEREWIVNPCECVAPAFKNITHFDRAHLLVRKVVQYGKAKVCPCGLRLYLLAQRVLKAYFRGLQLNNLSVQPVTELLLGLNLFLNLEQGLVNGLRHSTDIMV